MAKTDSARATSRGICNYCKGKIEKGKMTQHLKFCKQRIASFKTSDTEGSEKTRLFHLLVEGTYLPMYWMHLEVPADATLADVDGFLRAIWLECCGHLSAFRIGKVSYSSHAEDMYWGPAEVGLDEINEGETDEEEEADLADLSPVELADRLNAVLSEEFGTDVANLSVEDLEVKLTGLLVKKTGGPLPTNLQSQMSNLASFIKLSSMFQDTFEDRFREYGMDVELGKVLTVGQKFSYTYDFGSSTELSLRVQAEREGFMTEDEDLIEVMARNESPDLVCEVCGKPATKIVNEYTFLCDTCTKNRKRGEYGDMVLPVVNSPRAGVCGYTGEYEYAWEGEEYDEEEYEDDEDEDDEDDEETE